MPPAPMYASFAAVTLLVLGLLVMLARASQAMFDDAEERETRENADSGIPATGAARIERHADTGQSRAERREREILDDAIHDGSDETDEARDENPWEDADDTRNPWSSEGDAEPSRGDEGETEPSWSDDATDACDGRDPDPHDSGDSHDPGNHRGPHNSHGPRNPDELEFTTGTLLANVAVSQGLFGAAILGAAWLAKIPPAALGVESGDPWNVGLPAVALGVGVGVALYLANELSSKVADTAGIDYSEGLREALAPDTPGGWAVLLGLVLPIIAGFEELLFRAALIGAFSTGFGVSPWILAVLSTVAFAIGHGAQGPGGVAVTGLLGFALAAAFVLTGSLLVVVVAHYLVNALEFGVHEGLGIEWA